MARGWESKAVESQIDSAEERASQAKRIQLTAAQVAIEREQESVELSRTRILDQLSTARNPKYREQLQQSLEFLNAKLAKFREPEQSA